MAKINKNPQPLQLDLFQVLAEYPEQIINNPIQNIDLGDLDMSKNVLVCNVKKDNVEHFLDGTAKIYYTGKRFPTTVALNKLYYFIPYIGKQCDQDFFGIRDLYLIKIARVGSRREGELDNDPNDLRLVFELQFVKHLFPEYKKHNLDIWRTYADTTLDKIISARPSVNLPLNRRMTYVSLFSCAGVGCFGFKQENYDCVATVELIERRLNVQKYNHKCLFNSGYICGDITLQETQDKVFNEIQTWHNNRNMEELDVVIATPPCQGMSVANHKKGDELKRNSLVVESIKLIQQIMPRFFVFENVPAFLNAKNGRYPPSQNGHIRSLLRPEFKWRCKNNYFLHLIDSPLSSNLVAECTILSKMASAAVVFKCIMSYQLATGSCDTMMVDIRP